MPVPRIRKTDIASTPSTAQFFSQTNMATPPQGTSSKKARVERTPDRSNMATISIMGEEEGSMRGSKSESNFNDNMECNASKNQLKEGTIATATSIIRQQNLCTKKIVISGVFPQL
jgi:hypothetical protein